MPRYRSKLDAVIRQRRNREEEIRTEFLELKNRLNSEEDQLRKLRQEYEAAVRDLAERQANGMAVNEIDLFYRFMKRQSERLEDQQKIVMRLRDECEVKREELASAMREKKVVEKVDAAREGIFNKELKKNEQRLSDEVAGRPKRGTP